jgi:hypothetical protein
VIATINGREGLPSDRPGHGRHRPRKRAIQYSAAGAWGNSAVPITVCDYWIARLRAQ